MLKYTLITGPSWPKNNNMYIDSETGFISWFPTNKDRGIHKIVVRVTDSLGFYRDQHYNIIVDKK